MVNYRPIPLLKLNPSRSWRLQRCRSSCGQEDRRGKSKAKNPSLTKVGQGISCVASQCQRWRGVVCPGIEHQQGTPKAQPKLYRVVQTDPNLPGAWRNPTLLRQRGKFAGRDTALSSLNLIQMTISGNYGNVLRDQGQLEECVKP